MRRVARPPVRSPPSSTPSAPAGRYPPRSCGFLPLATLRALTWPAASSLRGGPCSASATQAPEMPARRTATAGAPVIRFVEVRPGAYRDSVALMQVSRDLTDLDGVSAVLVAMATELNLDMLVSMGFDRR